MGGDLFPSSSALFFLLLEVLNNDMPHLLFSYLSPSRYFKFFVIPFPVFFPLLVFQISFHSLFLTLTVTFPSSLTICFSFRLLFCVFSFFHSLFPLIPQGSEQRWARGWHLLVVSCILCGILYCRPLSGQVQPGFWIKRLKMKLSVASGSLYKILQRQPGWFMDHFVLKRTLHIKCLAFLEGLDIDRCLSTTYLNL